MNETYLGSLSILEPRCLCDLVPLGVEFALVELDDVQEEVGLGKGWLGARLVAWARGVVGLDGGRHID